MTGIVILPAGRDDAFEDYKQFIRDGHPIEDIESYLDEEDLELFRTTSETAGRERVRTGCADWTTNLATVSSRPPQVLSQESLGVARPRSMYLEQPQRAR